jgi:3-hydroxyisobutyrate dehydrogenase
VASTRVEDGPPAVGVVGLGRMGLPIAARLRSVGLRVIGTDRRGDVRDAAEATGVSWMDQTAALAAVADVVVTVLPGPGEVRESIDPIVSNLRAGGAWLDMTSAVPAVSQEIRRRAGGRIRTLECPVGGNPDTASSGTLVGYLGAEEPDRLAFRALLDHLCRDLAHAGPPGTGYAVKLLVNLLWFGQAVAVSEVFALASRIGLDPHDVRATLAQGPAASRFLDHDAEALLRGDDMTTFALARCVEELQGVLELGAGIGASLPVAERVTDVYAQALEHYGDRDGELLAARLVAERLGVRFAPSPRASQDVTGQDAGQ